MTPSNDEKTIKISDDECVGSFYQLSQTADGTETTLLPIDRPVPEGEQVILGFRQKILTKQLQSQISFWVLYKLTQLYQSDN